MKEDFVGETATRALQASLRVRQQNLDQMRTWGAYSLVKVVPPRERETSVDNYVTHQAAVSGKTPREMEDILGLKINQLAAGAHIYRLLHVPKLDEFLPRGYTTLVDGLHLKPGLEADSLGYRPGHGAFQITLIKRIPATRIAILGPDEPFDPGLHPETQKLYARG